MERLGKKTGQKLIDKKSRELNKKIWEKNQKIIEFRYCQ